MMYLSQTNITELRDKVENRGGFQIALAPIQPATYLNVKIATETLYQTLIKKGYQVLVDDRGQKPNNMFKVIDFLGIQHRIVISGRSISAGVYEYKNLRTDEFVKVPEQEMLSFILKRVEQELQKPEAFVSEQLNKPVQ